MTSAAVTERSASLMNVAVQNTNVRTDELASGFTRVMDKATENRNLISTQSSESNADRSCVTQNRDKVSETDRKEPDGERTERTQESGDSRRAGETTDEKTAVQEENAAGEEAVSTQMYQVLIEQTANLLNQAAESLGVSVDEIMKAMEQLEMDFADLLNPDQMQALALTVTGEEQMSLLTDEELYLTVQELAQAASETADRMKESFSMDSEEWNSLIEQLRTTERNGGQDETAALNGTGDPETVKLSEVQSFNGGQKASNENGLQSSYVDSDTEAQQAKPQSGESVERTERSFEDNRDGQNSGNGMNQSFADTLLERAGEFLEKMAQESAASRSHVDAESIMEQILEHMKLKTGDQLSEIEMQLHPQSLGTLHISVAAKNGVVTAQLAAQNESAKEAIESQVAILKESLEEQGIKVEAVEVTVASHEFEKNLEQNAKQEADQAEESGTGKKSTRRIRLGDMAAEKEEDLEESERITRDMMMRHGNQIDYLA